METKDTYLENEIENINFCVNEAKSRIESAIDYTYSTGYESDTRSALCRALELLNGVDSSLEEIRENFYIKDATISESKIIWHPYPQEKPPIKEKNYLVTLKKEYKSGIELEVHERLYGSCGGFESLPNGRIYILNNVIAWAYPPKPYKEKKDNG